MRESSDGEQEE